MMTANDFANLLESAIEDIAQDMGGLSPREKVEVFQRADAALSKACGLKNRSPLSAPSVRFVRDEVEI